jgi:glucosamine-6-phosphate deaminase
MIYYVQCFAAHHNGMPGGKPNTDDTYRPERASPAQKSDPFSPHPDDDVISMRYFSKLIKARS